MAKLITNRKIIHIDMDAFYAAVEQRDNPALRGKPIGVGGSGRRGILTTASYEARVYGVKSAMPGWKALQLCPELIFVKPRFEAYAEVSRQIRQIFKEYTDLIEPLSLDEAFLDVTENKKGIEHATEVAQQIMQAIFERTQLTCSAGVSYCKFLAKVASDINKPNGLTVIKPQKASAFLEQLPIEKFFGIGKVTAEKMKKLGINNGKDLKKWSEIDLAKRFGKMGRHFYRIVRGIDNRPVVPDRVRKSIGVERTLSEDVGTLQEIKLLLDGILEKLMYRLNRAENYGRTLTLKLKSSDFQVITRSKTVEHYLKDRKEIRTLTLELLENNKDTFESIRLVGLSVSNLEKAVTDLEYIQLKLEFPDE